MKAIIVYYLICKNLEIRPILADLSFPEMQFTNFLAKQYSLREH
jgi:hypothetical protein